MSKFYTDYVYIGYNFIYPFLGISELKHRASINGVYLYSSLCDENIDNGHLLCSFDRVTEPLLNHKNYVKSFIISDKRYLCVFKIDEDLKYIIKGRYSKLSEENKKKILNWHYGKLWETNNDLHIKKCLYPEEFLEEISKELHTDVQYIKELCNKIDIEKESLIIF